MVRKIVDELYDFRLAIKLGIDTNHLISSKGLAISEEIKEQFVVLGKSASTMMVTRVRGRTKYYTNQKV